VPRFLQPLTAMLEGRAPQTPRVLKPESSSGLLQVSLPYPKGGLRNCHVFIMPHSVCIYLHKIVLQFCLFLRIYPSCGKLPFSCLAFSSSCAILSQAGLLEVPAAYRGSLGYFLARSLLLLNDCSSERLMLTEGGAECAACLVWFRTLSVCTLPP
jgi:hypothetical protein